MGTGDVTRPLPRVIVDAMQRAAEELAHEETFRGYCPENGYEWLRQTIIDHFFLPRGIPFHPDEVFISEGAGSDLGNLSELFTRDNKVAIMDPTYPAYVDANIMAGREITFLPCLRENNFVPDLPSKPVDIIYLCFPNNPTGAVLTRDQLRLWVDYAHRHKSIIIFDAAYEAYISSPDIPHSIYEIEGAREVAIEVHSFSKSAGFTSVRCGSRPSAAAMWSYLLRPDSSRYGCVGNVPNTTVPPMSPNAPRKLLSRLKDKKVSVTICVITKIPLPLS